MPRPRKITSDCDAVVRGFALDWILGVWEGRGSGTGGEVGGRNR